MPNGDRMMDLRLTGKRILVTGSNTGIGRSIAQVLAREGACVIVHGRNSGRAEKTAAAILQKADRLMRLRQN